MPRDFYDLFDVPADASEDEIESTYNELVKEYHPDINDSDDAEDKFKTVQTAYETLTDDDERNKYDELGHVLYVRSYVSGDLNGFEFSATAPEEDPLAGSSSESSSSSSTRRRPRSRSPSRSTSSYSSTYSSSTSNTQSTGYGSAGTSAPVTDIPFKPKVHNSIIIAVTSVTVIFAVYLYSLVSLALSGYGSIEDFFTRVSADPATALSQLELSMHPPSELLTTLSTDPLAHFEIAFVFAASVFLPLTLATIVWKMGAGQRTLWIIPLGTTVPLITFLAMYLIGTPLSGAVGAVLYIAIPLVAVAAFVFDVTAHIVRKYIEFYIAYYKRRYAAYRNTISTFFGRLRRRSRRKYRRIRRRWGRRYTNAADRIKSLFR